MLVFYKFETLKRYRFCKIWISIKNIYAIIPVLLDENPCQTDEKFVKQQAISFQWHVMEKITIQKLTEENPKRHFHILAFSVQKKYFYANKSLLKGDEMWI